MGSLKAIRNSGKLKNESLQMIFRRFFSMTKLQIIIFVGIHPVINYRKNKTPEFQSQMNRKNSKTTIFDDFVVFLQFQF